MMRSALPYPNFKLLCMKRSDYNQQTTWMRIKHNGPIGTSGPIGYIRFNGLKRLSGPIVISGRIAPKDPTESFDQPQPFKLSVELDPTEIMDLADPLDPTVGLNQTDPKDLFWQLGNIPKRGWGKVGAWLGQKPK